MFVTHYLIDRLVCAFYAALFGASLFGASLFGASLFGASLFGLRSLALRSFALRSLGAPSDVAWECSAGLELGLGLVLRPLAHGLWPRAFEAIRSYSKLFEAIGNWER